MSNAILNRICNNENDPMLGVKICCKHGDLLSMQTLWSKDPYVATYETYIATDDPYVATYETYVATEDPYIATNETYVITFD
ncbi:hypothetical protein H5410_006250 [Solanum commersonii]|uniref:Uncharacterized protein n=1 Tax=Solanum commersonii TaxID=4109 RepID=A0A9J6A9D1_SOLCO|nr:hypothetical protein H5410_006250 [Solanum commersonii]